MKRLLLATSVCISLWSCGHKDTLHNDDPLTVVDSTFGKISDDSLAKLKEAANKPKNDELSPGLNVAEPAKAYEEGIKDTMIESTMNGKPHIIVHHSDNDKLTDSLKQEAAKVRKKK